MKRIHTHLRRKARAWHLARRVFGALLVTVLLLPSLIGIVPPRAQTARAAGSLLQLTDPTASVGQIGGSAPTAKAVGNSWTQINGPVSGQDFFGVNGKDDHLPYRVLIGGDWETATADDSGADTAKISQLVGKGGKIKVQVFRKQSGNYPPYTEYQDPTATNHRNLTLVAGSLRESTAAASGVNTALHGPLGLPTGVNLALDLLPPVAGINAIATVSDTLFGGNDQHASWVFTGDGNAGVQMNMVCADKSGSGSTFGYIGGNQKPIVTALDKSTLGDDQQIANVDRTLQNGHYNQRRFDSGALAKYLCDNSGSVKGFDHFCKDKLQLKACVSSKQDMIDALGGLFDPLQWVVEQMTDIVSGFVGFVTEGLRSIGDIGNLASSNDITQAWKVMRDLVDVIFLLALIVIAFSTMLRLDTQRYSARALLPRLIFAVIAVNFSLLFVTILINTATILGNPFLSGLKHVIDSNPASNVSGFVGKFSGLGQSIVLLLAAIVIAIVLLILLLFFVVRIIMIWLLAALAPFAFLFMVLPLSRSLASMWLKHLLKWVYMAPISFIILWIGAKFLAAADGFGTQILSVLMFIGVVIAAVMIPLRLGGEVMQRAANIGQKGGGRLGLSLADRIPTGRKGSGAPTLGTRIRGVQAGLAARGEFRESLAQQHLAEQIEAGKGIGRLAGPTEGQRTIAQQKATAEYQKQMATIPPAGKLRIAHAFGNNLNAGDEVTMRDASGKELLDDETNEPIKLGALSSGEAEFAKKKMAAEATFAELSQAGIAGPELGEKYAKSGLAQLAAHDPAMSALERTGEYRQERADAKVEFADFDAMDNWDDRFLKGALRAKQGKSKPHTAEYDKVALESLKGLDASRAAYAVTRGLRQSMKRDGQRALMKELADAEAFEGNVNEAIKKNYNTTPSGNLPGL